jgi:hypothetical protein
MSVLKRRPAPADALARWAWIAVALTPAGWALGIVLAFLSGEGGAKGIGPVTAGLLGVVLFVAAPAAAVMLAVRAARAGHRSGRIAEMVSGSLLVATLFLTLLLGWIGLAVTAVVAALVFAWARPRHKPSPPRPDGVQHEGDRRHHDPGPELADLDPELGDGRGNSNAGGHHGEHRGRGRGIRQGT